MPRTRPYKYLKADLIKMVEDGTYLLGELMEPKTFTKIILKKGEIVTKTFTVEGRRIPLDEIRIRIYKQHLALGNRIKETEKV